MHTCTNQHLQLLHRKPVRRPYPIKSLCMQVYQTLLRVRRSGSETNMFCILKLPVVLRNNNITKSKLETENLLSIYLYNLIINNFLTPRFISFSPANCSNPTLPTNSFIEAYHNTTEGAEIYFSCNPEFVPAGRMGAVCASNGRWNPDPAGFRCTCECPQEYS